MPIEEPTDWPSAEDKAKSVAQAQALRQQAQEGGLRFEAYLPPRLADWLLGLIEAGDFTDPSEAVFVMLGEQQELEPHADLRDELLNRRVQSAIADPRPGRPAEEVFQELRAMLKEPRPEPALWTRNSARCTKG
jgi:antitoxin ParD1/3/4